MAHVNEHLTDFSLEEIAVAAAPEVEDLLGVEIVAEVVRVFGDENPVFIVPP
jgi:hypothetical protein